MNNIESIIETQQLPAGERIISLSPDGKLVTLPKSDLIELIIIALPDVTLLGFDSNLCIKYNQILKELGHES